MSPRRFANRPTWAAMNLIGQQAVSREGRVLGFERHLLECHHFLLGFEPEIDAVSAG